MFVSNITTDFRMSSTIPFKNDNLDPLECESFNYVKQERDEMVVGNETMLDESIRNEFSNGESKYITNQINGDKVWSKEEILTTWNSHSVKTETIEEFNTGNESTVYIFPNLGVKTELNEMKVEEVTDDTSLIRNINHHMQNENNESSMTKQLDLSSEKCDLTSIDSIHSVKTETCEDIYANEESKSFINQMTHENEKVWPKEEFSTSWNFHSVKLETSGYFNIRKENVGEMFSSIQMEPSQQKCDPSTDLEHSKSKNHKCHLCDYTSSHKGHLQSHIKSIHLKLKNQKCYNKTHKCHLCDYSASHEGRLQLHIQSVHLKQKLHKCNLCDYSSSIKGNIHKHLKSVHLKLKNHKCDLCDYSSSHKGDLQRHLNSVHVKLKNLKCDLCDYRSSTKAILENHVECIHLKLKNRKCSLCNYSSSLKSDLQRHIESVHLKLKNHKCHFCDYSSSYKHGLQNHMKSVHLNLRNHKCDLCDYSSSQKGDLQMHIKSVHLKLRNHKCDLCAYTSSRKAGLQEHIKLIHLKPKKHKCQLCDFSSSQKRALEAHMKSEHS